MTLFDDADLLLAHFDRCGLRPRVGPRGWLGHMGATINDAALQRRARYKTVVAPRVRDLITAWPDAVTVSSFFAHITAAEATDRPLSKVIRWRRPAKLRVLADAYLAQVYRLAAIRRGWQPGAIDAAVWGHMEERRR